MLDYVGEWHTHPSGSAKLSLTDRDAIRIIRKELDPIRYPTCVTIINGKKFTPISLQTMSSEINLKARNTPILWVFFTFNIILFASFLFANFKLELVSDLGSILTIRTTGIVVAPLILFVVNGLLSPDLKAIIVFGN
ncbi:hypothetical protein ACQ9BO_15565 [Flavobacterium sp. P21]|uniref:hypothetical protein n=1 Tax=Flavobacterium sp. P21 TaxID=3423948 RepID=UPI003D67BB3F